MMMATTTTTLCSINSGLPIITGCWLQEEVLIITSIIAILIINIVSITVIIIIIVIVILIVFIIPPLQFSIIGIS